MDAVFRHFIPPASGGVSRARGGRCSRTLAGEVFARDLNARLSAARPEVNYWCVFEGPVPFLFRSIACMVIAALAACDGGGGSSPAAVAADAIESSCGQPGDVGNELGIGRFCTSLGDCPDPSAPLCSILGDRNTHFCTKVCQASGPADQCGTGARCACNPGGQCGCTPSVCL